MNWEHMEKSNKDKKRNSWAYISREGNKAQVTLIGGAITEEGTEQEVRRETRTFKKIKREIANMNIKLKTQGNSEIKKKQ